MSWPRKDEPPRPDNWNILPEEKSIEWDDFDLIGTVQGLSSASFSAETLFSHSFVQHSESSSTQATQPNQLHTDIMHGSTEYTQGKANGIDTISINPSYADINPECSASTSTENVNDSTRPHSKNRMPGDASRPKNSE